MAFVTNIYKITSLFPNDEKYSLIDKIRRASVSISLNIAEGSGSGTNPEFVRFLKMAQRSTYEVMTALEIAFNLKYFNQKTFEETINEVDELSAMISGLIKSLTTDNWQLTTDNWQLKTSSNLRPNLNCRRDRIF